MKPSAGLEPATPSFPGPAHMGRDLLLDPHLLNKAARGGHFAAWEEPELFAAEVRAAFRSLRWPERDAPAVRVRGPAPLSSARGQLITPTTTGNAACDAVGRMVSGQ